jgi:iron complex outermembrane receptor protein
MLPKADFRRHTSADARCNNRISKNDMNTTRRNYTGARIAPRLQLTTLAWAIGSMMSGAVPTSAFAQAPANAEVASGVTEAASTKRAAEQVIVVGNPLRATDARDVVAPLTVLSGDALLLRRGNTLGESLNGLPGVGSSWFGPNAGRPVIRGLDGDRVKVLSNLGASLDASSISYDHNPAIDPLFIERVEVLRGPAALLYGGTAIGGVVNVVDNRIPASPITGPRGAFEGRAGGADHERSVAAMLETGNGIVSFHADAFKRSTDDYRVPSNAGVRSPIVNSSGTASGGALGGAVSFDSGKGNLGVSHSNYQSNYGTVAEEDVRIDMRQTRTAAELNWRELGGTIVDGVFVKASRSDYRHTEFEGVEAGTVFTNKGNELRAEVRHAPIGNLQGVVGVQREAFDFAAEGDEAFVPKTNTRNTGVFVYEEFGVGPWRLSGGVRRESSRVRSAGGAGDTPRFGAPEERRFNLTSASLGSVFRASEALVLSANIGLNQRAPAYYELFANGPHVATAAYEVGDRGARPERATAIDLGLKWRSAGAVGLSSAEVSVFSQRFSNYLLLSRTGVDRDAEGNRGVTDCGDGTSVESGCTEPILPEYVYKGTQARLYGGEASVNFRALRSASTIWDWRLGVDYVRADDRSRGQPLPRIAPLRVSLSSEVALSSWRLAVDLTRAAKQARVPDGENGGAVAGYTLLGASLLKTVALSANKSATLFLRGTNLGNARAFNAASIDTIRQLAPLPGRSIKAGVRVDF